MLISITKSASPEYTSCEVIAIPGKFALTPFGYGFQKNSPYLGLFNYFLHEMREKGVLKEILVKYESAAQVCPDLSGKPLGINSSFTAFLLLIGEYEYHRVLGEIFNPQIP